MLFRRLGWEPDDYQRWSRQLLADQVALVTPTKWEGETVARFAFLHPDTTMEMVAEILASMRWGQLRRRGHPAASSPGGPALEQRSGRVALGSPRLPRRCQAIPDRASSTTRFAR